jgi:inositol phosphorylceramide mannosyltransferase catalytic subunit
MNSNIPRRIIQTNKSIDLPLLEKAAAANVRLLNPDFEYLFFDDRQVDEFIDKEFPEYRVVFDSFPIHIQRYDFFRYLAVYRLGGFYFDTDVFLASNLSELLGLGCVFPFEALSINTWLRNEHNMDWEVGNYAFGASAGHPFLRAIIENCVKAQKDSNWAEMMARSIPWIFRDDYTPLYTTGPLLVSRTLAEFPDVGQYVKVLFPEDVCDVQCWYRFGHLGVHLMGGSWRKPKGFVTRRLLALWQSIRMKRIFKECQKIGKQRSLPRLQGSRLKLHSPACNPALRK